ncbi:ElyC/SanA/YdcF family protein [Thioalkalicoccus limnaeus]|uniref:ElyC/SanA/YdcF family protein n=1 Tax=Thioalkalicoccus limnaeus TaxID=120681 RepID=A0ABV4BCW4_9GAMM
MDDVYGTVKGLAAALLMPFPVALGLVTVGVALRALRNRGRVLGGWLVIAGALLLVLASWQPVADALLSPLEERYPPLTDPARVSDVTAVVVLGGGWWPGAEEWPVTARLSESSAIRLFEGLRLIPVWPEARLVLTGASRRADRAPVAWGYAEAARDFGVPETRILVLDTPVDTAREAEAVRAALGDGARLVLVTSASHMPRAMAYFRRVGLDPVAAPTHRLSGRSAYDELRDWLPAATYLRMTERAWYEYLGLLAQRRYRAGRERRSRQSGVADV